ncbi:MAG TPA: response regulator [Tepidisphaeraceae bacterium]|jgi:CheY-like chemotaxis protein|nr:response regulator [Tepidisphaeraceae bacterium]
MAERAIHKILIIDDNASCREVVATALRLSRHRVICAGSSREAIQLLENSSPDLILLDLALPEMSGLELLRTVRQMPQWRDLPVILFTGSGDIMHLTQGLGVSECLIKSDFSADALRSAVARALGRRSAAA